MKNIGLLALLIFLSLACNMCSRQSDEVVFATTEVGKPIGDKVTKVIGSAGGSLSSPDGKLTVTVPNGAVSTDTSFSIQPITNTVETGIGIGYHLAPGDVTFATPVKLSVTYDDADIKGTVPEMLSMAYQDSKGAWHAQNKAQVNQEARTVTVSTKHFSSWITMAFLKIIPTEAKVFVGEQQFVAIAAVCPVATFTEWWLPNSCTSQVYLRNAKWKLNGPGSLTPANQSSGAYYFAPARKPSPNQASVEVEFDFRVRNDLTGEFVNFRKAFETYITIVDRGYKATGNAGPSTVFKGVICDLNAPFSVDAINPIITYPLKFEPSSETNGTWKYSAAISMLTTGGSGTYQVEDNSSEHPPRIAITGMSMGSIPVKTLTGGGSAYIYLVPNDGDECLQ